MTPALVEVEKNIRSVAGDKAIDPVSMLRPCRKIRGISAILLPFQSNGDVDWAGFTAHVQRTVTAGLAPAVNMDTGYAHLINDATRVRALESMTLCRHFAPNSSSSLQKSIL